MADKCSYTCPHHEAIEHRLVLLKEAMEEMHDSNRKRIWRLEFWLSSCIVFGLLVLVAQLWAIADLPARLQHSRAANFTPFCLDQHVK